MATLQSGKCFTVPTFLECVAGLNDRKGCIFTNDMKLTRQNMKYLCSYCLQWNTSQSKFRNHYFLFLLRFHTVPTFSDLGLYYSKIIVTYWLQTFELYHKLSLHHCIWTLSVHGILWEVVLPVQSSRNRHWYITFTVSHHTTGCLSSKHS